MPNRDNNIIIGIACVRYNYDHFNLAMAGKGYLEPELKGQSWSQEEILEESHNLLFDVIDTLHWDTPIVEKSGQLLKKIR